MKIALVQIASPDHETVADRRDRVGRLLSTVEPVDLIILPELWAPGYFAFDRYLELAEPLNGDTVTQAQHWAKRAGCYLHLGSVLERDDSGAVYNTAVLIDSAGHIVHTYRKVHVFGYQSREAEILTPGTCVDTTGTPFGRVGATTCYDLRFPELWRALIDHGAEIVTVPAAWPAARRAHWQLFTSVRAVEEQIFVIACNAVGTQRGVELGGHSRVVDPWGEVVVEASDEEGVTVCEIDPTAVAQTRSEFPVLRDRHFTQSLAEQQHNPVGQPIKIGN